MTSNSLTEIGKDFLTLCAFGNPRKAFSLYADKNLKHHNAYFKGDADSLMIAMEESAKENPNKIFEIKHVIADGNMVAFHSFIKQSKNETEFAVVHILKFSNNKITEFWDIVQPIPEEMLNENGMF